MAYQTWEPPSREISGTAWTILTSWISVHPECTSVSIPSAGDGKSPNDRAALRRLQIAIALRRGLSVIMGDVGTGKTTLSRKLAQDLKNDEGVDFHLILNPYFRSERQFLQRLSSTQ